MGFFDSKSSTKTEVTTISTDKRIATAENGLTLQTDGANATINFENLSDDVVKNALNLADSFIGNSAAVFNSALSATSSALDQTQALSNNLFQEQNNPGSNNIKNIAYAGLAAFVAYAYFKGN